MEYSMILTLERGKQVKKTSILAGQTAGVGRSQNLQLWVGRWLRELKGQIILFFVAISNSWVATLRKETQIKTRRRYCISPNRKGFWEAGRVWGTALFYVLMGGDIRASCSVGI